MFEIFLYFFSSRIRFLGSKLILSQVFILFSLFLFGTQKSPDISFLQNFFLLKKFSIAKSEAEVGENGFLKALFWGDWPPDFFPNHTKKRLLGLNWLKDLHEGMKNEKFPLIQNKLIAIRDIKTE